VLKIESYIIEIVSINEDGKIHKYKNEHHSLELAVRDILTYHKRNYRTLEYNIRKEDRLF